jgi:hypothetical protein
MAYFSHTVPFLYQHNLHTSFSGNCYFVFLYFGNDKGAIMKKQFSAILVALLITACVGASIFAIGGAALLNKNSVPVSNSSPQVSQISDTNVTQPDQVAQLQNLVSQYQDHEKQYQQREQQLQQQLSDANAQVQQDQQMLQQVQALLSALQQRGLITITNDGRIRIN